MCTEAERNRDRVGGEAVRVAPYPRKPLYILLAREKFNGKQINSYGGANRVHFSYVANSTINRKISGTLYSRHGAAPSDEFREMVNNVC